MSVIQEAINLDLLYGISYYAGELFLRVIPMFIAAVFLAESARLWVGDQKLKLFLAGKHPWTGRFRAAALGAVLPFCECGAFPIMLGLIRAGVPGGAVLTFFLISPVVSMPAFLILVAVFGFPLALAYLLITTTAALLAGLLLEPVGLRWGMFKEGIAVNEGESRLQLTMAGGGDCAETNMSSFCSGPATESSIDVGSNNLRTVLKPAWLHTLKLLRRMLPYIAAVILASALLRNLVPEQLIEQAILSRAPFDILIGALVGIPVYSGDCAMIALAAPLIGATGAVGAGIAFIISGSGTSISGIIFMSSVFKRRFIIAYVLTVFCIALVVGYLISALLMLGLV
jgi:uncharacterized protein